LSGDPAWDLFMEARWDRMCPGSRDPIMAAYTALHPLDEQDWRRVLVYRLAMRIEFALDSKQRGQQEKNRVDLQKLMVVLEQAEQEFRG
jgi:hypothetical protein